MTWFNSTLQRVKEKLSESESRSEVDKKKLGEKKKRQGIKNQISSIVLGPCRVGSRVWLVEVEEKKKKDKGKITLSSKE